MGGEHSRKWRRNRTEQEQRKKWPAVGKAAGRASKLRGLDSVIWGPSDLSACGLSGRGKNPDHSGVRRERG